MLSHLADTLYVETPSLTMTDAEMKVDKDDDVEAATTYLHNGNGSSEDEVPAVEMVGGAVPPHPNIIKPPAADHTTYVIE
jgi:hypothetical protein